MLSTDIQSTPASIAGIFTPAEVLATRMEDGLVRVSPVDGDDSLSAWARIALPLAHRLRPGQRVLVAGTSWDNAYVIGVLDAEAPASGDSTEIAAPADNRLEGPGGAYAVRQGPPDQETLQVFSPQRELLFEYDPQGGKTRLNVPAGDLEICATEGDLLLSSAGNVRMVGGHVDVTGRHGVRTAVESETGASTSVELSRRQVAISGNHLAVSARQADATIENARYTGKRYDGTIGAIRLVVGRIETIATTVIERTKDLFTAVAGLYQVKSGRMRTTVDSTISFKSRRAHVKTDEDFKVKGRKIHLG